MPRYFFNLDDGHKIISDPDGTELPDDQSAREHAVGVMQELARNREERTSTWRLIVCDANGTRYFELAFASINDAIFHVPPRCA
jgi:hypothetical protein